MTPIADSSFLLIGTVTSALGVLLTVVVMAVVAFVQRTNKSLSCWVTLDRLISIEGEEGYEGKMRVLYDDVDVRSLYRVETKISNSGNRPIHPNDFIEPIRLTFEQPSKVLTAAVTSQSPAEIGANINHTHQEITVHALLLNPKDSFSIRALIGDLEVEPAVSGRIVGVKEIMKMPARAVVWIIRTACFATLIAIIGGVWTLLEASVFAFAVSYAGFVLMAAALVAWFFRRRKDGV